MRINKSSWILFFSLGLMVLETGCKNQKDPSHVDQKPSTTNNPPPPVQEEQKLEGEEENLEAQCFQGSQEACDQLGH